MTTVLRMSCSVPICGFQFPTHPSDTSLGPYHMCPRMTYSELMVSGAHMIAFLLAPISPELSCKRPDLVVLVRQNTKVNVLGSKASFHFLIHLRLFISS